MSKLLSIMIKKGVPSKYQEVEYIESSGTQYIDTEISAPNGFVAEINCMKISGSAQQTLIWCELSSSPWNCNGVRINGSNVLALGLHGVHHSSTTISINQKYKIEVSTIKSNGYIKLDGANVITQTTTENLSANNLYLGANNAGGTAKDFFIGRFYPIKIWDYQRKLIRFYIPVFRKADNELGMFDIVERKFYTNSGTGNFINS